MSSTNDKERLESLRIDGIILLYAYVGVEAVFDYIKEVQSADAAKAAVEPLLATLWQHADAWARLVDDCGGEAILEVAPGAMALYLAVQGRREEAKAS